MELTDDALEGIRTRLRGQTSPQAVETLAAIEELQRRRKDLVFKGSLWAPEPERLTLLKTLSFLVETENTYGPSWLVSMRVGPLASWLTELAAWQRAGARTGNNPAEDVIARQAQALTEADLNASQLRAENRTLEDLVTELRRRLSERERDTVTERANRDAVAARVTIAAAEAESRKIAAAQIEASQPVDLICSACRGQHTGTKDQIGTTCGRVPPPGATWLGLCRGELYRADGRENGPRPAVEPLEPACPQCGQLLTIPVDARHPTLDTFSIQCFCGQLVEAFFWSQQGELEKDVPLR